MNASDLYKVALSGGKEYHIEEDDFKKIIDAYNSNDKLVTISLLISGSNKRKVTIALSKIEYILHPFNLG